MFQFKQFQVKQEQSAMKIGTDAVLLGAWTPINNHPKSILDIGAGTGILALMLAQRTNATQIDALEIDENAYEECVENFENSPWDAQLFCYHAGLDEFVDDPEEEYDLIISNPPFYTESYKSPDVARELARFEDALPFEELIEAAVLLLSDIGFFSVIIPFKEEQKFISLCEEVALYPCKITHVKGTAHSEIKRSLLCFTRNEAEIEKSELQIELERHQYTKEYIALTKDFYLKM